MKRSSKEQILFRERAVGVSTYDEPLKSPQSGRSETRVVPNGLSTRSDKRECAFGTNSGGTARKRPVFKDVCAFLFSN